MQMLRALIWLDRYLNVLAGGEWPETFSCRYGRLRRQGCRLSAVFCMALDTIDPGHCERSLSYYENLKFDKEKSNESP
jgi:hypothetical protein